MTDVRVQLKNALRDAILGAAVDRTSAVIDRQAEAAIERLLELPGIAIVELPKAAEANRFYYRDLSYVFADSDGLIITDRDTTFGDADEVREMAAALLAAAVQAQEEQQP